MTGAWLFSSKRIDAFPASWKKIKSCAVVEAMYSYLDAILLDFLKVREETSVSIHILRFYFLKSFASKAL